MPLEIVNKLRSRSVIRLTGNTATLINLTSLSVNTQTEIVESASINHVICTGDGTWKVYRGNDATGNTILELRGESDWPLSQYDIVISSNATSNIYITNSGTVGTLILGMTKQARYPTPLTGI